MTREEYEEICSKYSEFIILTRMGAGYIKKSIGDEFNKTGYSNAYKVTDWFSEYDEENITSQTWCDCELCNEKIYTNMRCLTTKDKYKFDENLQLFIKNYKNALIELKKEKIKKEFENE